MAVTQVDQFWDKNIGQKDIKFEEFFSRLSSRFLSHKQKLVVIKPILEYCLKSTVTKESWDQFLNWFGPLDDDFKLFSYVVNVFSCDYFVGFVDAGQAKSLLTGAKPGTYLVRFSASQNSFVISYVDSNSVAQHVRYFNSSTNLTIRLNWVSWSFYFPPNHYKTLCAVVKCKRASQLCQTPFLPQDPLGKRLLHVGMSIHFPLAKSLTLAKLFNSVVNKNPIKSNVQDIKFELIPEFSSLPKSAKNLLVLIEIQVPQTFSKRAPIELALIIDVSTNDFLQETKQAVCLLLDLLQADDVLHVFTWGKTTKTIITNGFCHGNALINFIGNVLQKEDIRKKVSYIKMEEGPHNLENCLTEVPKYFSKKILNKHILLTHVPNTHVSFHFDNSQNIAINTIAFTDQMKGNIFEHLKSFQGFCTCNSLKSLIF